MKKNIPLALVFCIFTMTSCKKDSASAGSPAPTPTTGKCKPLAEPGSISFGYLPHTYSYHADGTMESISSPPNETVVTNFSITRSSPSSLGIPEVYNTETTEYNADIFTSLPTLAKVSITIDGITQVDYWEYQYTYDSKSRLIKVVESTPHLTTDLEYMLTISYSDQDNVTLLTLENTTGPRTPVFIPATGYDDKPGPYSAIKNPQLFIVGNGWGGEPSLIFEALSKNNPLGFDFDLNHFKRTMVYTYNDNGYPITRTNTNTNLSGTVTFAESYTYQCE